MTASAKVFRTIDVIAVLTNVQLDRCGRGRVDELVRYVTGHQSLPKKGTNARRDVIAAIRPQLPAGLNTFGIFDVIQLVVQLNDGRQEEQLRSTLIRLLEERYGHQLSLCPESTVETPCESLLLLRSLAERPYAKIPLD